MQKGDDDKRHPVGFYSTTLTPAERNYDIYDLELLAIIKSLRHWRPLLAGRPHQIKVFSDHMNLQYWRDPQKISRRVAREVLELVDYDIKNHHLKGSANGRADTLSRRPDFDQGEGDNEGVVVLPDALFARSTETGDGDEQDEGVVVLPDALFARSTETGDGDEQDEGVIRLWVDPHQLKKIDGV